MPLVVNNFDDCAKTGQPIMESYPRRCNYGGKSFVEDIGNELEKTDLIRLESPRPNEKIASPVKLRGQARGNWYFEASFPVALFDANGTQLAVAPAQAKGEWMTTEFVPFELSLEFPKPATAKGYLLLKKDNPSGETRFDDQLKVPVSF